MSHKLRNYTLPTVVDLIMTDKESVRRLYDNELASIESEATINYLQILPYTLLYSDEKDK